MALLMRTPINLSILDFKIGKVGKSYGSKRTINLSILDFKIVNCQMSRKTRLAINLSILDFKTVPYWQGSGTGDL